METENPPPSGRPFRNRLLLFVIPIGALLAALVTLLIVNRHSAPFIAGGHDTPIIVQGGSQTIWSKAGFANVSPSRLEIQTKKFFATSVQIYVGTPPNTPNPNGTSVYGYAFAVCTDSPHKTAIYSSSAGNDVFAASYNPDYPNAFDITEQIDATFGSGYNHKNKNYMGQNNFVVVGGSGTPADCYKGYAGASAKLYCSDSNGKCSIQIDYCDNPRCENKVR